MADDVPGAGPGIGAAPHPDAHALPMTEARDPATSAAGSSAPRPQPSPQSVEAWAGLTRGRNSVRDFRPDPIPESVLRAVLEDATTAPSWSNTQPYRLAVASGALRDRISAELCAQYDAGMRARRGGLLDRARLAITRDGLPDGDFRVPERYPDDLQPARVACGRGLYEVLGIDRSDRPARDRQMRRNFELFGAPTVVFVLVHEGLGAYAVLDAGVMLQTLMLAAHARGLGSCAQGALALWAGPVRRAFDVPRQYQLICGVSLGYPTDHPVNRFRPGRAPLDDVMLAPRER